jgi:hypothetical protein
MQHTPASTWKAAAEQLQTLTILLRGIAKIRGPTLRGLTSEIVGRHYRYNTDVRAYRYSWGRRVIGFSADRPLVSLAAVVSAYVLAIAALWPVIPQLLPLLPTVSGELRHTDFQDLCIGLLAAQAALIALVFPLIIALVGVLFEFRSASQGRMSIFFKETEAVATGASSLFLCAALAVQPLFFSNLSASISIAILIVDIGWFLLNVLLLGFFLFRTLDFVRPEHRPHLVRGYTANVAWRQELRELVASNRLLGAVEYGYLPSTSDNTSEGPKIYVNPMLSSIPPAASVYLKQSSIVRDIHFGLLNVVAVSWLRSARTTRDGKSGFLWLVFSPVPGETYSEEVILARSPEGLPLNWAQKLLVRLAYRFSKPSGRTAPTTAALLKEHASDLILSIDAGRLQEFQSGLNYLIDFHVFLFQIAKSPDRNGSEFFNYAEMNPLGWRSVGDSWAREYGDVFKRSAARLSTESEFFGTCAYLSARLYRQARDTAPARVLSSINKVGLNLFWRLREWADAAHRSETASIAHAGIAYRLRPDLAERYAGALREFVAGWERLGSECATVRAIAAAEWELIGSHFIPVWEHLKHTATMVAANAKSGDLLAAEWCVDVLLKWLSNGERGWGSGSHTLVENEWLLTPDIFKNPWNTVLEAHSGFVGEITPNHIFAFTTANAWRDVQLSLAAVLIHWAVQNGPNGAASLAARKIIHNEHHDRGSGADYARPAFPSVDTAFGTILRIGVSDGRGDAGHSTAIDDFIERLDDLTTEPFVSGRIYSTGGMLGFQQLSSEQGLILMALFSREPGRAKMSSTVSDLLKSISLTNDHATRQLIARLEGLRDAIRSLDPAIHGAVFRALV